MNLLNRLFGIQPTPVTPKAKETSSVSATTKLCPRCNRQRNLSFYGKNRSKKDGLQAWCTPCTYAAQKKRRAELEKATAVKKTVARKFVPARFNEIIGNKTHITVTVTAVERSKYEKLVNLAQKQKVSMNQLYQKMINDFLTLNA